MSYEISFFKALFVTIFTEVILGIILMKLFPRYFSKKSGWQTVLTLAAASFMTLPYVWFLWPAFIRERNWYIISSESWVVMTEALFYVFTLKLKPPRALLFSIILNSFSVAVGLIFSYAFMA